MSRLSKLVQEYLQTRADDIDAELAHFCELPFPTAVEEAANARGPDGKILSHQRRPGRTVLAQAAGRLSACLPEIRACKTFEALLDLVRRKTADIFNFGKLCQYDTALRIGAKLNIKPTLVYLHAGTLKGARLLGFETRQGVLTMETIAQSRPELLRLKSPDYIESFLCWLTHRW
jgi:hypothetical protein